MTSPFMSFKLTGDPLKAAREFNDLIKDTENLMGQLHAEFDARRKEILEEHKSLAQGLWQRIVEPFDLDPDESWDSGEWYLENSFLQDHGDAFLGRRSNIDGDLDAVSSLDMSGSVTRH